MTPALQELHDSDCVVADNSAAQLVYVDLYCPYITWLAAVHMYGEGVNGETPTDNILKVGFHWLFEYMRMARSC